MSGVWGGGVGRLMANAILNFHFDYLNPSLIKLAVQILCKLLYHVSDGREGLRLRDIEFLQITNPN